MLQKLDYRDNVYHLSIQGNFRDGKDSLYFITDSEVWHVSFVKTKEGIEEWIRDVVVLEGMNDLFIGEIEFRYRSHYKTMSGVRSFIKKQPAFSDHKETIIHYLTSFWGRFVSKHFYPPGSDDIPF